MTQPDSLTDAVVGALDVGTTGVRFAAYSSEGHLLARSYRRITTSSPRPGWVEQDPTALLTASLEVIREVTAGKQVDPARIRALGIANQRETIIAWNARTGEPVYPAIVWQDRRTADRCHELAGSEIGERMTLLTGLPIDPYFSATKIEWLLDHVPMLAKLVAAGDARLGTVDSWILWHLTGKHVTDETNASRTQLFDIRRREWSTELLEHFRIPSGSLPSVVPSTSVVGSIRPGLVDGLEAPVAGVLGDQQAALLGQGRTRAGEAQVTWGTGAFLLMNCGDRLPRKATRLVTTIALAHPDGSATYAFEGSVFVAGAAIDWLQALGLPFDISDIQQLASGVESTNGVAFVPAHVGLGCPHWDPSARAAIFGMTLGTKKEHLVRAAIEAIAYQTADVIRTMETDGMLRLEELCVGGGVAGNDLLCQFQSDILGVPVVRPQDTEATSRGAAFAAGLAVRMWDDVDDIRELIGQNRRFTPSISATERDSCLVEWRHAVACTRRWTQRREEH